MTSSQKLKSFRQKHNLTQRQLADLLGVKQQTITYIETGAREPSDGFKLSFLRHYKVDFDELGSETEKSIEIASNMEEKYKKQIKNLEKRVIAQREELNRLNIKVDALRMKIKELIIECKDCSLLEHITSNYCIQKAVLRKLRIKHRLLDKDKIYEEENDRN